MLIVGGPTLSKQSEQSLIISALDIFIVAASLIVITIAATFLRVVDGNPGKEQPHG